MKIVACVGVKDEVELIAHTLDHLRAIGVDKIIVMDDYSTDGTSQVLEKYCSTGTISHYQLNATEQSRTLDLVRETGADWAIFLDADEYWLPATGCLKDCVALAQFDLLSVDRFNVPLGPDGVQLPGELKPDNYDRVLFFDRLDPSLDDPNSPWISIVPAPKVMVRLAMVDALTQGIHDVRARENVTLRRTVPDDLLIAHLPFTTRSRFKRKVSNIGTFMREHPTFYDSNMARNWRRLAHLGEQGLLDQEYERQIFSADRIAHLAALGGIQSAAQLLARRMNGTDVR